MRRIDKATRLRIIGLATGGNSRGAIAAKICCARASVDLIVRAYRDERRIAHAGSPGRPSVTIRDEDLTIVA